MSAGRHDATVIGGGVVGLATAMRLARAGMDVVLIERHESFGREASSRNSEVVHAGMYYPTGSLKARFCVAGNRSLSAWCSAQSVPMQRLGKFIVATSDDEAPVLAGILERGHANGVTSLRWAADGELAQAEPRVRAVAALFSPDTGIIDSHALMQSFADEAAAHDAALAWGHEYVACETVSGGYRLRVREPNGEELELQTRCVVNAAGLNADLIAEGAGLDIDALGYRLRYVKGNYFRMAERWRGQLTHLIYPVPHVGLAGLGVHVTLDLAGGVRLGPDVEFLDSRRPDYSVPPDRAASFAEAVSRYLPGVTAGDLRPDQAGIRARRIVPGETTPDFIVAEEREHGLAGWVNLIGIESPGLTSCLEIADEVVRLLDA
ncbi:MAG: NAD(P)/FAD-dependent oxidoreductase [Gemmatimonadota bacterium]